VLCHDICTGGEKILVFVEMKRTADFIASYLSESDIPTTSIHGDRLQRERETALCDFKDGRMRVLVATAVAARGLGNFNKLVVNC
jgi:probable ATP-dependent RNA helicase DDX4